MQVVGDMCVWYILFSRYDIHFFSKLGQFKKLNDLQKHFWH